MEYGEFYNTILMGFRLSRIEFLWGSPFPFAKKAFKSGKKELDLMLKQDGFVSKEKKDSHIYMDSVLNYYRSKNIQKYEYILIGIAVQRYSLVKANTNEEDKNELKDIAYSALQTISSKTIKDKQSFAQMLIEHSETEFPDMIEILFDYLNTKPITNNNRNVNSDGYVFISYSTEDAGIVSSIKEVIEKNNIRTWFAQDDIKYGDSYAKAIEDAISKASCFLAILSANSVKSKWVEKEIDRALNHGIIVIPLLINDIKLPDAYTFYLTNSQICKLSNVGNESFENQMMKIVHVIQSTLT
ncbi:MAG: toll/interleukin-1 receptor domain-containing protein [Acholeplasma sp.]|jgi:hypothetical protein|nr:MAG: toll/interleukin-1 receptor domain-containing protein [Acholeplasma sp.]